MKILFLDIDGVVNCEKTFQRHRGVIGIDPMMAFRVGKIVLDTDCKVVLSSSWRHSKEGIAEVERQVVPLLDRTPNSDKGFRGDEVAAWLAEHPKVTAYAILDDDSDFHAGQHHFKTSWKEGITDDIMHAVIKHLNR